MKRNTILLIATAIASLGFISCGGSGGGGSDDDEDRSRIAAGTWTSVSLSANVESGAMTDRQDFIAAATAGTYVVECRNLSAGVAVEDFTWFLGAANDYLAPGNEGQEAADAVELTAGDCWITIDNDADVPMSCQFRIVPLSESNFFIPNDGSKADPVELTVGVTHKGKAGLWPSDDDYAASWYIFTTGVDGTYTITLDITNGSSAAPFLYLDTGAFGTGAIDWGGAPMSNLLLASTTYYLKVTMTGGDIRPIYDLTVNGP